MKQIVPNVYFITGLPAGRVYGLEDPDGLTLIDATFPVAAGVTVLGIGLPAPAVRQPAEVR